MTSDEMAANCRGQYCAFSGDEKCLEMLCEICALLSERELQSSVRVDRCDHDGRLDSSNCRQGGQGVFGERSDWISVYVRTRLMTLSSDDFRISRYTVDLTAHALRDRFLADADFILKLVLDRAELRHGLDGATTITVEDVAAALQYPRLRTDDEQTLD